MFRALLGIFLAAGFLISCFTLSELTGFQEVATGGRVGYAILCSWVIWTMLTLNRENWPHIRRVHAAHRAQNGQLLHRWRRLQAWKFQAQRSVRGQV